MAYCTQCGAELADGARFCAACGASVGGTAAVPVAAPPAEEPVTAAARTDPPPAVQPSPSESVPPIAPVSPAETAPSSGESGGGGGKLLALLIGVALLVVAIIYFTQRDGTRPVAGGDGTSEDGGGEGGDGEAKGGTDGGAGTGGEQAPRDGEDGAGTGGDSTAGGGMEDGGSVSVATIDAAFAADPQGAAARYERPFEVRGTIATMVTPGPTPSLSLEGRSRFNFVIANLADGERSQIDGLSKGDAVRLSCGGARGFAGTTFLEECRID